MDYLRPISFMDVSNDLGMMLVIATSIWITILMIRGFILMAMKREFHFFPKWTLVLWLAIYGVGTVAAYQNLQPFDLNASRVVMTGVGPAEGLEVSGKTIEPGERVRVYMGGMAYRDNYYTFEAFQDILEERKIDRAGILSEESKRRGSTNIEREETIFYAPKMKALGLEDEYLTHLEGYEREFIDLLES